MSDTEVTTLAPSDTNTTLGKIGLPAKFSPIWLDKSAHLFQALGDKARLSLLFLLRGQELSVTEIADTTGEGLSTVSQRLRILRQEGLVDYRREGKHLYYYLADQHVVELIENAITHVREISLIESENFNAEK